VYLYEAGAHRLTPVVAGDLRARSGRRAARTAPVNIFYVVDRSRYDMGPGQPDRRIGDPEVQKSYYYVATGLIAQNVYLFCASEKPNRVRQGRTSCNRRRIRFNVREVRPNTTTPILLEVHAMEDTSWKKVVLACCAVVMIASCAWGQDWPQWRGPNRDGKVTGFTAPQQWPAALTQKWKVTVGTGCATPALVAGKLYVFARQGDEEVILCLDADTGQEKWKDTYAAQAVTGAARRHPGPRSSAAVAQGKVVTLGVGGVLSCLDAATGKLAQVLHLHVPDHRRWHRHRLSRRAG